MLKQTKDDKLITQYFLKRFSASNFFEIFTMMKNYIDIDAPNTKDFNGGFGRWYVRQVYANLCMRIKLYLEYDPKINGLKDTRSEIFKFIGDMACSDRFNDIERSDFKEIYITRSRQKAPITRPDDLPKEGERFHILKEAPPKRRRVE